MESIEKLKINCDKFEFIQGSDKKILDKIYPLSNQGLQNSIDEYYSSVFNYKKLQNWPVVYIIEDGNHKNIYIGETQNFHKRFTQHLQSEKKNIFGNKSNIRVYFDESFNKSAILDIEAELIKLAFADNFTNVVNGNKGQSIQHDYYQKFSYQHKVEQIWKKLREQNIARQEYINLRNSFLYKYSPYTALNEEQWETCIGVLTNIINCKGNQSIIINGEAGTGKTVLAMYFLNILLNPSNTTIIKESQHVLLEENDDEQEEKNIYFEQLKKILAKIKLKNYKVGLVVQKESLRITLTKVAKRYGIKKKVVFSPSEVAGEEGFDVLIVDEAHRIKRAKNNQLKRTTGNTGIYDTYGYTKEQINKLKKEEKENLNYLHILKKKSKTLICMYDKSQTVHSMDIDPECFHKEMGKKCKEYSLKTQMRCQDGSGYLDFIEKFLFNEDCGKYVGPYDFKLYENVDKMVNDIKKKDKEMELCRNVAGFAWPWKTKGKRYQEIVSQNLSDIQIENNKYIWNTESKNWVFSEHAIDEIGFIDTIQGYDLNYVGVILGEDIKYDNIKKKIVVDRTNCKYESLLKGGTKDEDVDKYIRNTYKVLMTRGIKGCYIYVCDKNLREYFKKYVNVVK